MGNRQSATENMDQEQEMKRKYKQTVNTWELAWLPTEKSYKTNNYKACPATVKCAKINFEKKA